MSVLPFLGIVILVVIALSLVRGAYWEVFGMFMFFAALQVLLSILAIRIDTDDLWLARYAPFSIAGYKQFLDGVLIKSLFDVLSKSDLSWTSPRRLRQRDNLLEEPVNEERTPSEKDAFR